jgi:hypothetical protein
MGISVNTANKETANSIKIGTTEHPNEIPSRIVLLVVSEERNNDPLITLPCKEMSTDPKKRGQDFRTVTDQPTCSHYVIDYNCALTHTGVTFIMFV